MRRLVLALFGAVAVTVWLMPVAAHASTSRANSVRTVSAAGISVSAGTVRDVVRTTLPVTQCSELRQSLHNRAAKCSVTEILHLTAVRQPATGYIELTGYLQACASMNEYQVCDPDQWWVTDRFHVTLSGSQSWNNGTPQCAANHTSFSWCSYANNGKYQMQEGFNFGNNGWTRLYINANDTYYPGCNSYAACTGNISAV